MTTADRHMPQISFPTSQPEGTAFACVELGTEIDVLQHLAEGRLAIIARGSDVEAIRNQTIRVNVANANALAQKRDAFVRYLRALARAIDWAYSGDAAIDAYAEYAKVPRALAQRVLPQGVAPARRGQGPRPHAPARAGVQVQ